MCNLYSQTKSQDAMRHVFDDTCEDDEELVDLTRNLPSKRWLGIEHRCLVPFASFSRIDNRAAVPRNHPVWFALGADRSGMLRIVAEGVREDAA